MSSPVWGVGRGSETGIGFAVNATSSEPRRILPLLHAAWAVTIPIAWSSSLSW